MKTKLSTLLTSVLIMLSSILLAQKLEVDINETLQENVSQLVTEFDQISDEHKKELTELGDFLIEEVKAGKKLSTLFVCTHNSRRSHIADLWYKFALFYYGINGFESFSGGTEATAFNANAIAAIERAGFSVLFKKKLENPVVSISPGTHPVWNMQSKVYTHNINPKEGFVAVMVCSDADKSCPVVDGSVARFSLPYDDPRYFDDAPSRDLKYDETVDLIGREMLFLVDYMKNKMVIEMEGEK